MPFLVSLEWAGVTPDQYLAVHHEAGFEKDVPQGAILHVAAHDGTTLRITDVWETPDDFNKFAAARLIPVVNRLGIHSQPKVQIIPVLHIFAPGIFPRR